jgi:hypothetical protein
MEFERLRPVAMLAGLVLLAAVFAQVEIQIEGAAGWAAGLPTWRIERHPLLDVFWGGRPLTGYHVWVFLFMALVFHFGILIDGRVTWRREARTLGSLMLFWILEDALWFILNPAFGFARLTPAFVPWHKHWLCGMPADYATFSVIGSLLLWASFRRGGRKEDAA